MIRNIIFDMGQVLINFDPEEIVHNAGITGDDAKLMRAELLGGYEWVLLDRGVMTYEEAHRSVCKRLPERLHKAAWDIISGWWKAGRTHIDGMEEIILKLKNAGYGVFVLTNASLGAHEYINTIPGHGHFDGILISADIKLMKPEHDIYERFCDMFYLPPVECIFIDDNPANVAGAIAVGMEGIIFRGSPERLVIELREKGIEL